MRACRPLLLALGALSLGPALRATVPGEDPPVWAAAAAEAAAIVRTDPEPRRFLGELLDDFGGRLTGSPANAAARARLLAELRALGWAPVEQIFEIPGWERGDDRVEVVAPFARPLRAAALSGCEVHPAFEGPLSNLGRATPQDYPAGDLTGGIGLVDAGTPFRADRVATDAAARGLRAVLLTNRVDGGQVLARSGDFHGTALPVPVYSVTLEEGLWLARLAGRGVPVRLQVETRSRNRPVTAANVILRIPGGSGNTLVVGAHFDSWDLGQGALDNGLGVAQLLALARVLRGRELVRPVELVWFDGEEQGLWGSRYHAASLAGRDVSAMLNLDMVGEVKAVNALGADLWRPVLEAWNANRPEPLAGGVENLNWFASDHTPYQLAGIPALTFNAPIKTTSVRYYHDLADTRDKLYDGLIEGSASEVASLVVALALMPELPGGRLTPPEVRDLFTRFNLVERLEQAGLNLP